MLTKLAFRATLLFFILPLGLTAQSSHQHTPWCGNHIFDHKNPTKFSPWAKKQVEKSMAKKGLDVSKGAVSISESEPNDSFGTGNFVDMSQGSATVTGTRQLPFTLPNTVSITSSENNDSIGTATPLGLIDFQTNGVIISNVEIGDGQFGNTSGDFDFYGFNANVGELLLFDINSFFPLDPIVGIYDSNGNLIRIEDDERQGKPDPYLRWTPEANGTYYLCVAGFARNPLGDNFPMNAFQSGTGRGAGLFGEYELKAFRLFPFVTGMEPNGVINQAIPIIGQQNAVTEFFIFGRIDNTIISGDFDLFAFQAGAGQTIVFEAVTSDPFSSNTLDPALGVYSSFGTIIDAKADDDPDSGNGDVTLIFTAQTAGTYYLVIGGQSIADPAASINFPQSGFDGFGSGISSTGFYTILVTTNNEDPDFIEFDLEQGELFSARVIGEVSGLGIRRPNGSNLAYTTQNANAFSAPGSPFPLGNSSLAFIAPESGRFGLEIFSAGSLLGNTDWEADLLISEPNLKQQPVGTRQIIFVDFDGAVVDAGQLTGPDEMRQLSPLSTFLPRWGIPANRESDIIDGILARMEENLIEDIRVVGANGDFDTTGNPGEFGITLLNSRDHADPWGQPFVSRIIIGGTVEELGVQTLGIAQSIDPGNFQTEETAVVLLDGMSEPATGVDSLFQYTLGQGSTIEDIVTLAVGNIASHEIGHYIGNWHTVNSNATNNTMDQGGSLRNTLGIGADDVLFSPDDIDVDFVEDTYEPGELYFSGREATFQVMSFGLSTGTVAIPEDQTDLWMMY